MSSFIGHSLAAVTISYLDKRESIDKPSIVWQIWLICTALAPDIDYLIVRLQSSSNGVRITHSLIVSLIIPLLTIMVLIIIERNKSRWVILSGQVALAGLSHVLLDLLVGVTPEPVLWPISSIAIKLPLGILPSAGKIDLKNYYFYRNLLIEGGILIPISCLIISVKNGYKLSRWVSLTLIGVLIFFLAWSTNLPR